MRAIFGLKTALFTAAGALLVVTYLESTRPADAGAVCVGPLPGPLSARSSAIQRLGRGSAVPWAP